MKAIDIFPWNENFCTGIDRIDEQHEKLVGLLNSLATHVVYQADLPGLDELFAELASYAVHHFATEEDVWHQYFAGDPLETGHKAVHESFVAKVVALKADATGPDRDALLAEMLSFLTSWLVSHILQSDRQLGYVVQGIRAGLPLEQAKAEAKELMLGTTPILVQIILALYGKFASNSIELMQEISARRESSQALAESQAQLSAVIDSSTDLIWSVDSRSFGLLMFNREMANELGRQRGHSVALGQTPEDLFHDPAIAEKWRDFYHRALQDGSYAMEDDAFGDARVHQLTFNRMQRDGEVYGISVFGRDVTEQKSAVEAIHHLAFYDPLTNLPNRRLLQDRLRQAVAASDRRRHYGAVVFIDLDNFKILNDTRGHDVGDLLLIEVAARLADAVREGDTVARIGGDEFVVVLNDLGEALEQAIDRIELVCKKILEVSNQTYRLGEHDYRTTASLGACPFKGGATGVDELLQHADTAMYQAKNDGRNMLRFFDPAMQSMLESRVCIETWMRGALPDQFQLYYQAQVDSQGRVLGAEVLLRWTHPQQGMIPPSTFIPLAEESGLILPIGAWVLQQACHCLKAWESDPRKRLLQLAVNVSARQFHQENFVQQVLAVIDATGIDPTRLKLELTESMLVSNVDSVVAKMSALKARGVSFSLDDFGTGYSSLSLLKRLPLDQVKIDQSFVRDILTDANDAAIARTIAALGQSLGLMVIAEGVETEEQRAFLAVHGCNHYQGYLFSRPIPQSDFESMLQRSPTLPESC